MKIKNWKTKNSKGDAFDFFKWKNDSWALLMFFRGKNCGICRKFLMKINENSTKLNELNIKPLAISNDNQMDSAILSSFLNLKFENLPDPGMKIIKRFDVPMEKKNGKNYILPGLFLINPGHEIVWSYQGKNYQDLPSITEIFEIIEKYK